ncbi:hypothetical protein C8R44DRAFT_54731 [Mycena epipterygia]|nr:hypothetical protein C8R44DRAFT_54731 [Mycena epipterygia]
MQLPQELINGIIDEVDPFPSDHRNATLKSCALAARSFLHQSQTHLFFSIELQDDLPTSPLRFSRLLLLSPHLAIHVRILTVECHATNWEPVAHILASVSNLTGLKLSSRQAIHWHAITPRIRAPFQAPFSFPCLRAIELCHYELFDVLQLQSLVSDSTKLDSLVLNNIFFIDSTVSIAAASESAPRTRVTPTILSLRNLERSTLDSILDSSTAVDIKYLKSLSIDDTPAGNLIRLNTRSLRNLSLSVYNIDASTISQPLEASDLLSDLETLAFDVYFASFLPIILRLLGAVDLRNMKKLERVAVGFSISSQHTYDYPTAWREFDAMLCVLLEGGNALKKVDVSIGPADSSLPELLRSWMPSLNAHGILKIITPGGICC